MKTRVRNYMPKNKWLSIFGLMYLLSLIIIVLSIFFANFWIWWLTFMFLVFAIPFFLWKFFKYWKYIIIPSLCIIFLWILLGGPLVIVYIYYNLYAKLHNKSSSYIPKYKYKQQYRNILKNKNFKNHNNYFKSKKYQNIYKAHILKNTLITNLTPLIIYSIISIWIVMSVPLTNLGLFLQVFWWIFILLWLSSLTHFFWIYTSQIKNTSYPIYQKTVKPTKFIEVSDKILFY